MAAAAKTTQSSVRTSGTIVAAIGLLFFAVAFLWMKYSLSLQIRAAKIIRRVVDLPVVEKENVFFGLTRWFGVIFFGDGVLCLIFGLAGLVTGRSSRTARGSDRAGGASGQLAVRGGS